MPKSKSWVMHLPVGLRDQPAWIFIGILTGVAGLSYLLGFSRSTSIASVLDPEWIRVWGALQLISGSLVVASTILSNRPLERLALRFLSLGYLVYLGWIITAVSPTRAMVTIVTCISLIGMAEIRAAVLKVALKPIPVVLSEVERR